MRAETRSMERTNCDFDQDVKVPESHLQVSSMGSGYRGSIELLNIYIKIIPTIYKI